MTLSRTEEIRQVASEWEFEEKYAELARERLTAEACASTVDAMRSGQVAMFGGG